MKRLLIYTAIAIGVLVVGFTLIAITVFLTYDSDEINQHLFIIGYAFGTLLMICAGGTIIFGMFKLTMMLFFKKDDPQDDDILDKDGPIDRYLK